MRSTARFLAVFTLFGLVICGTAMHIDRAETEQHLQELSQNQLKENGIDKVSVSVSGNVCILQGTVAEASIKERARSLVSEIGGVEDVNDQEVVVTAEM